MNSFCKRGKKFFQKIPPCLKTQARRHFLWTFQATQTGQSVRYNIAVSRSAVNIVPGGIVYRRGCNHLIVGTRGDIPWLVQRCGTSTSCSPAFNNSSVLTQLASQCDTVTGWRSGGNLSRTGSSSGIIDIQFCIKKCNHDILRINSGVSVWNINGPRIHCA